MSNPTWPPPYSLLQCLDRLPARARRKYDDLKALLADAEALQRSLQERVRAKEDRLADLRRRREYASVPGGDAAAVAKLDREVSAVRADLDRLERERSRRNGARANTEQVVSRLDNFILQLFSGASDAAPPRWPAKVPGPRAGESLADALIRLRREINIAQGELRQVKTAPPPASEIKAALVAEVDRMAGDGRPSWRIDDGGRVVVHWPDVQPYAAPGGALSAPSGSASRMLAALFGDQLKKLLVGSSMTSRVPSSAPSGRSACARSRRTFSPSRSPRSGWSWPRSRRAWRFIVASMHRRGRSCTPTRRRRRSPRRRSEAIRVPARSEHVARGFAVPVLSTGRRGVSGGLAPGGLS
jgi:hypothetical protein